MESPPHFLSDHSAVGDPKAPHEWRSRTANDDPFYAVNGDNNPVTGTFLFGAAPRAPCVLLEDGNWRKQDGSGGYGGSGCTGGKVRSSKARVKKTPYDRPAKGRHATPGGSAAMAGAAARTSIASRLKASASYLFGFISKLRFPIAKSPNGDIDSGTQIAASHQEDEQEQEEGKHQTTLESMGDPNSIGGEKKELDIIDVENVLKQKTLSREQVDRLTEILQSRLCQTSHAVENLDMVNLPEKSNRISDKSTPLQVALAHMGDESTKPPSISNPIHSAVASHQRLFEDRYNASPFPRTWSRRPHPHWMPKKRFLLEPEYEEDNEMSCPLPVRMAKRRFVPEDDEDKEMATVASNRRVRRRVSILPSSSPYLCRRNFSNSVTKTHVIPSSPPERSRQTAQRILEMLENVSPSPKRKLTSDIYSPTKSLLPKGKQLDEYSTDIDAAETSMNVENQTHTSSKPKQTSDEWNDAVNCEPSKSSTVEHLPLAGAAVSCEKKGFRMNAVFEESNSDEETKLEINKSANVFTSGQLQEPMVSSEFKEVPVNDFSPPNASVSASSSLSAESTGTPLPSLKLSSQPNHGLFKFSSSESTTDTTVTKPTSNFMSFPIYSSASTRNTETKQSSMRESPSKFLFTSIASAETGPLFTVGLTAPISKNPSATVDNGPVLEKPDVLPLQSKSSSDQPTLPTLSSTESGSPIAAEAEILHFSSSSQSIGNVKGISNTTQSTVQSSVTSSGPDELVVKPSTITPASQSEGTTPSLSFTESKATPSLIAPVELHKVDDEPLLANDAVVEPENVVSMATESQILDKTIEVDTMATDSMTEEAITTPTELSATTSLSPAPAFSFGGSSSAATSSPFSFASNAVSSSGSKFGVMSDSTHVPAFGSMFSSSSSGNSNSSFGFGSSPSVAATNPFFSSSSTSTSSSPLQFGAATTSSTSSSIFGSGNSSTTSSTSVFGFSSSTPSNTSSGTTPFLFGTGISQQSTVAASSGQPFAFGSSQSNPFVSSSFASTGPQNSASNPFAASGASSTSSNVFGTSSSTPNPFASSVSPNTVSTFQFGSTGSTSTTTPPFSFGSTGSASTSNPSPFLFGSTGSTSTSTPSPFLFGSTGSTSTTASSPFPFGSTGSTQSAPTALSTFSFGSSSTSSSSMSPSTTFPFGSTTSSTSAPSTFAFGSINSQPAFSFSSMTASSPSPSPFGSTVNANPSPFSSTAVPASFSFGSSSASAPPSSPFSFGSTPPAPTPSPFTFGSQPQAAPISNGQPFTFGGQPGTPLQSPFNSTGPTPSAPDFTGGFALGATGGEKSGRKFIKAKRLGGAKRGK